MPVPFKVKAVFEYKSAEPDDLNFGVGQIITVTDEDEPDWYTGEYENAGATVGGIFPRNFVEKYEPAIPSRPVRPAQKSAQPPPVVAEAPSQPDSTPTSAPQITQESRVEPAAAVRGVERTEDPPIRSNQETRQQETKPPASKPPPAVAEKPASSSFRDRIAAFNKPAATPIAPFKPGGAPGASTSFIKKPFVPPPPSRNSYIPPTTQAPPPAKIYRREEDPDFAREEQEDDEDEPTGPSSVQRSEAAEEQVKPTSLKDRIALLQQQQLEAAQRATEKKKAKRPPPPPKRPDSADNDLQKIESTEAPLTRQETEDTTTKRSLETERSAAEHDIEEDIDTPEEELAIPTAVPPPPRELTSDTNDADDSGAGDTEDAHETSTEEDRRKSRAVRSPPAAAVDTTQAAKLENEGLADEEAENEEDTEDEDPEVRRRRELRERMAKMSGGMGMMGMFGPPGGMPMPSKKPKPQKPERTASEPQPEEEMAKAPPVPIMALPGMSSRLPTREAEEETEEETIASPTPVESTRKPAADEDYVSHQPIRTSTDRSGPTSPYERTAPPPPPRDARAPPPPPIAAGTVNATPRSPPGRSAHPPPPPPPTRDDTLEYDEILQSPASGRSSLENRPSRQHSTRKDPVVLPQGAPPPPPIRTLTSDSFGSNHSASEKRLSRQPPPPPPGVAPSPSQTRAPPPPPPGQPPSRSVTSESRSVGSPRDVADESEEEVTEYDGDYDTDIASNTKHKDALKTHNRDSSMDDEGTFTDEAQRMPTSPPTRAVPPLPQTGPPRNVPPPLPPMSPPSDRMSGEAPRAAPPPIPSAPVVHHQDSDDEYDPYRYSAPQHGLPSPAPPLPPTRPPVVPPAPEQEEEDDMYSAPSHAPPPMPPPQQAPPVPTDRAAPPPPPPSHDRAPPPPPAQSSTPMMSSGLGVPPMSAPPRQSLDINRAGTVSRKSTDQRPSTDFGFMASDIDLSEASLWWTHDNTAPPSIAARNDVLFEVESSTNTKRGGKTTVTRDVYILYMDYSQTTVNVSFDPADPNNASINQSHQRPPPPPRQDQLESVSQSFGSKISAAASQASGSTVADGSSQGFIWTLLQPLRSTALMPVGNRAFGAVVYSNLGNVSPQQYDEIRPGDIVTFRNAKFAGHQGRLHQKYTMDAGTPGRDHVAVVIDWDGTKKKIRAWEQGREEKKSSSSSKSKVKDESYRIPDLKSGEVKVWRVMGRSWVGWDQS